MSQTQYKVSIKTVDGKTIRHESPDVESALSHFKPQFIKGKVIVEVESGEKKVEKMVFVPQARRLFYNPMAIKIFARNIERSLNA